jgi:hypothetical protein
MIRTSGLIWWIRFPVAVYMAAKSVPLPPVPQVGVSFLPLTVAGRGSFLMSIAATSGFDLYRLAMSCQAAVNFAAGQLSLYHRPLLSLSAQHQPPNSMWQFGMTISPAPVRAATQAS